jgi:c-di-GMP-binding flagellar brake protein YcgR
MDQERRKLLRTPLEYFISVNEPETGRLIGYLADLTTAGALLVAEKRYQPEQRIRLRLSLPEGYSQPALEIEARVVWMLPDENPALYRVGLQFLTAPPEQVTLLARVIREHGLHSG